MYSIFIPEDKAGSIICQLVDQIPVSDFKRERLMRIRGAIKMLDLMHLAPPKPHEITSVSYGCNADGTVGIIILCGNINEVIATAKGN